MDFEEWWANEKRRWTTDPIPMSWALKLAQDAWAAGQAEKQVYIDYLIRTRCGDKLELGSMKPAPGETKKIPKRHFDDT